MHLLAVIDATDVDAPQGPATVVAGLSLLERTVRLADVCGADEIAVAGLQDGADNQLPVEVSGVDAPVSVVTSDGNSSLVDRPDAILILDAGAVYERGLVNTAVDHLDRLRPDESAGSPSRHLAVLRCNSSTNLQALLQTPGDFRSRAPARISGGWVVRIDSPQAVDNAARRLWNGCRKPEDGLVSRYLNRHISLAISRRLAPTSVGPNHVTFLTFMLGIAAAFAAACGHYTGFLLAGILYQTNSVVDGVDGELARVRYEFSFTGEWLDTISDDMADLLMYIGLGIGAWRTVDVELGSFGPELWLVLGGVAAASKVATMAVYYRWLIANDRGDLLAFQWSFEDDDDTAQSAVDRALSFTRYFFRKDFIVFAAMVLSFGGFLPHLLIVLAPGNAIVAISVFVEQLGSPD